MVAEEQQGQRMPMENASDAMEFGKMLPLAREDSISGSGKTGPAEKKGALKLDDLDTGVWDVFETLDVLHDVPLPAQGQQYRAGSPATPDLDGNASEGSELSGASPSQASKTLPLQCDFFPEPLDGLGPDPLAVPSRPVRKRSSGGRGERAASTAASTLPAAKPAVSADADKKREREIEKEGSGEEEGSGDPADEKRLKRMRRNRESAAMSRNRKKAYVEELEAKVAALSQTLQTLQAENRALKQECANYLAEPGSVLVDAHPTANAAGESDAFDMAVAREPAGLAAAAASVAA